MYILAPENYTLALYFVNFSYDCDQQSGITVSFANPKKIECLKFLFVN